MRKLAIVILNWNGSDMMRRYLPSVIACSEGDVIVADNASTDDSLAMLRREFPGVPTVVLDRNYGFADGYNRALAQLPDYEYYLLLNSDVEIRQSGWDRLLTDYMDAHPECGACQPKLLNLRRSDGRYFEYAGASGGFIDRYGYPFCRGRIFATVEEDKHQYDDVCRVHWATGAAMLVRATDFRAVGGLDADFFAHMEEIDLCWRLRIYGKTVTCVPQSEAWHLGGATLNQGNPRKTFLNFRNNLLMLYKNVCDADLSRVMAVRCLLDYVAMLQFVAKLDFANAKAVLRARREYKKLRRSFAAKRATIQTWRSKNTHEYAEVAPYSILLRYYLRGKKIYSDL